MSKKTAEQQAILEATTIAPMLRAPDAASAVDDALAGALSFCASKIKLDSAQVVKRMQQHDRQALSYTHYGLAGKMGEALGSVDATVQAVYLFECDATVEDVCFGQEGTGLPIHLIVRTERKSPALASLATSLDRALTQHYAQVIGPAGLSYMLDIQIVDNADIEKRQGAAALLSSMHCPPIQVWAR